MKFDIAISVFEAALQSSLNFADFSNDFPGVSSSNSFFPSHFPLSFWKSSIFFQSHTSSSPSHFPLEFNCDKRVSHKTNPNELCDKNLNSADSEITISPAYLPQTEKLLPPQITIITPKSCEMRTPKESFKYALWRQIHSLPLFI
jgi:hypothetical protein